MTWIFDTCTDEYGSCIRQYVMFAVSLSVLLLAVYSCVSMVRQERRVTFELLPIVVNTVTSLLIFGIHTQMEMFNVRIGLLVVELYSYCILTYGFIHMALSYNPLLKAHLNSIKRIFIAISGIAVIGIVVVVVLSILDVLKCSEDQGAGSMTLVVLQIPLWVVTLVYSHKFKTIISSDSGEPKVGGTEYTHQTQHLLNTEDHSKKLKLFQLKMVRYAFVVSFVLHAIQLSCYYYGDEEIICSRNTNKITVTSDLELYILVVENISQLFPHFIIPFIFWYMPTRLVRRSNTYYVHTFLPQMTSNHNSDEDNKPRLRMNRTESKLVNDVKSQEEIRQKLGNSRSPERHVSRIPTL